MTRDELCNKCSALEALLDKADIAILLLTAHHNSNPDYVRGFDLAQEYMQDRNREFK